MNPVILAMAAGASLVSAHGYVSSWSIGGTTYQGFDEQWNSDVTDKFIAWTTTASDNGYVAPDAYADSSIICHRGGSNAQLNNATVAAGDSITATWNTWPSSHHGPIIDYIAAADDPTTVDKSTLEWIKIQESGLISGSNPGTWAADELISNGLTWSIKIPSTLKPGNYVLRHEIIALHSAENSDGAQNYPQCVNLQVTGSGSELPDGTLGTALYTASDPGILFNIYTSFDSYTIPGPALGFSSSGSSSSGSSSGASSSAASATSATSATAAAAATSATSTTTSAATATATSTSKCSKKKRRHARDVNNNTN